jgi:hypothetical protein
MTTRLRFAYCVGIQSAFVLACTSGNRSAQMRVDTALVYVQASGSSHGFPQVQDSKRILSDGSILPDPTAPACASKALPDTQAWPRSSNTLPGNKQITLSIRLPRTLLPVSEPGRWEQPQSPGSSAFPSSFTVLMGPERGYPSSSFGGEVHQVQLHECKIPTPNGLIETASFVVQWAGPGDLPTHYVVARAPLTPDNALLVLAEAHDSLTQVEFVAALRTLVLSRN